MILKKCIFLALLLASCKTSSRDDFGTQMTDVSVKVPDEFTAYDSIISFSRTDSSAKPKIVRGTDIKVKLPSGVYKIDLILTDKSGAEVFRSCEISKFYTLINAKEDAIIDICRSSDRSLVAKTVATNIDITPNPGTKPTTPDSPTTPTTPTTPTGPGTPTNPGPDTKPGTDTGTQTDPIEEETPIFFEEKTCFGLPATYERKGNELIIKMTGTIKDHIFDTTNAPTCTALFNIEKPAGQVYAPQNYKLTYEIDEESAKQNFYMQPLVRDEEGVQAMACKTLLLNTPANSGAAYQCTFFDTSDPNSFKVADKYKTIYEKSCATKSFQVRFDFYLKGSLEKKLKEMKMPELRIQIPLAEPCKT